MSILFLTGPRGSGKSQVARLLGAEHSLPFCDTDLLVVRAAGKSIEAIVAEEGWPGFRAREKAALAEAAAMMAAAGGRAVVATGGGMVLDPENRAFMRQKGRVVYLSAPAHLLAARLAGGERDPFRPSLSGLPPAEELSAVLAEREPLYRAAAHHCVDASLPLVEVVRQVYHILAGEAAR